MRATPSGPHTVVERPSDEMKRSWLLVGANTIACARNVPPTTARPGGISAVAVPTPFASVRPPIASTGSTLIQQSGADHWKPASDSAADGADGFAGSNIGYGSGHAGLP